LVKDVSDQVPAVSDLWDVYQNLPRPVQRADVARLAVVWQHGGWYFDVDVEPRPKLESLMARTPSTDLFFVEHTMPAHWPQEAAKRYAIRRGRSERRERLANFAFYAPPKSAVVLRILEELTRRCRENPDVHEDYDVLYTTGPDCLTEVVQGLRDHGEVPVTVVPHRPYLKHRCDGSWRRNRDLALDT